MFLGYLESMAKSYTVHETKNRLSELLKRVQKGESVTIVNRREPVAKLVAIESKKRELGFFSGQIMIADDFDAPLEEFDV